MEKKVKLEKLDKFDTLILNKFKQIKKHEYRGDEDDFFDLFVGAKIKNPIKYLVELVQKNPSHLFKNIDEVWKVLNFFGFELFESQELYDLGGTKLFTKLIKKTLSGKYEVDEYGRYDGPFDFGPMTLLDDYLNWKYKKLENCSWDNLWKTFKKLPKLKLYQTIVINENGKIYWEEKYTCKIGWLLDETYSDEQVYKNMKQYILRVAKKQNLKVFTKDSGIVNFVREEDAKYFSELSEYKLIK